MTSLEGASGFKIPAGNIGYVEELKWQAVSDPTGSQAVSSLILRLFGNQGDPSIGEKNAHPPTSVKSEEEGREAGGRCPVSR